MEPSGAGEEAKEAPLRRDGGGGGDNEPRTGGDLGGNGGAGDRDTERRPNAGAAEATGGG